MQRLVETAGDGEGTAFCFTAAGEGEGEASAGPQASEPAAYNRHVELVAY